MGPCDLHSATSHPSSATTHLWLHQIPHSILHFQEASVKKLVTGSRLLSDGLCGGWRWLGLGVLEGQYKGLKHVLGLRLVP